MQDPYPVTGRFGAPSLPLALWDAGRPSHFTLGAANGLDPLGAAKMSQDILAGNAAMPPFVERRATAPKEAVHSAYSPRHMMHSQFLPQTQWPKIGGRGLDGRQRMMAQCDDFQHPEIAACFAGDVGLRVYVAGCFGLRGLSQVLDIGPVFKIGSTEQDNVVMRLSTLKREAYGSLRSAALASAGKSSARAFTADAGFEEWQLCGLTPQNNGRLITLAECSDESPVELGDYSINIRLPLGVLPQQFDRALQQLLMPLRLDLFPETLEGWHHCRRYQLAPELFIRHSPAPGGTRRCEELYIFGCQADIQQLIFLIEKLCLDYASAMLSAPKMADEPVLATVNDDAFGAFGL